jgi:hypothetical protein
LAVLLLLLLLLHDPWHTGHQGVGLHMMHRHPGQLVLGGQGQRVLDPHLGETERQQQQQQQYTTAVAAAGLLQRAWLYVRVLAGRPGGASSSGVWHIKHSKEE